MSGKTGSALSKFVEELEETLIALILALMTVLAFANVVARYVFNSNILWAKDGTVFLLAWLVLLGASYGVKKSIHIGVDIVINTLSRRMRKLFAFLSVTACLAFSILLLKGSWDYWYPYVTTRAWLETEDIPMPEFLQFFSDWLNDGERYEKMPVFIPYSVLPLSMALLIYRYLQVAWEVILGKRDMIISSHEAEEILEEENKKDGNN